LHSPSWSTSYRHKAGEGSRAFALTKGFTFSSVLTVSYCAHAIRDGFQEDTHRHALSAAASGR
jgi:hypothetical protein